MGKKGKSHRKWSKEEKVVYVRMHLEEHVSIKEIEKRYGIANNQVSAWVRRYLEGGGGIVGAKERECPFRRGSRERRW